MWLSMIQYRFMVVPSAQRQHLYTLLSLPPTSPRISNADESIEHVIPHEGSPSSDCFENCLFGIATVFVSIFKAELPSYSRRHVCGRSGSDILI